MNVIAPARTLPLETGPEPLAADLLAAWPVAPGALLLLGRSEDKLPSTGTAQYERRRSDRGPFRAASWKDGAAGIVFAAAVRLPSATELRPGHSLTFQGADGVAVRARLPAEMATPLGFAADAARCAGGAGHPRGAGLVRFLSGSFPAAALQKLPSVGAMLTALLAELSTQDGCIELMGAVPGACGFLQGWGGPVRPAPVDGALDVFLVGAHLACARAHLAAFARPDIAAPAGGVVLVLADDVSADLEALERVYLVGEAAVVRRDLVGRRVLTAADSVGHIRDLLPTLRCTPDTADTLRRALRPRFEGLETLSAQKLPVRAAVDVALTVADAPPLPGGVYVAGWLYDPADHVAEVHVRSTEGGSAGARLDTHWTRVPRTDVTAAMSTSGFPAPIRDDHGFAVHAEAPGWSGALYLDIEFRDGTCAFLPVRARTADDPAGRARAFDGTDLHKPSGIAIVERQLGPLIRTLMRRPPAPVVADPVQPAGWTLAVVVPLLGAPVLPRSFLSQFLRDRLLEDEGLLLVCGAAWSEGDVATLQRLVGFMDLPARILRAATVSDPLAALEAAAPAAADAAWFLLADPGTAGAAPGWRAALRAASLAMPKAVACPTLWYEDFSIRYAGSAQFAELPVAPYAAVQRPLAGMPAAMAEDGPPRPATLGTLACCLLPRTALPIMGHARAGLATAFGQEVAAFLRLQAAGFACLWVPQARVFAPETPTALPGTVARLVDGWCLRAAHAAGDFAASPAGRAEGRACAS